MTQPRVKITCVCFYSVADTQMIICNAISFQAQCIVVYYVVNQNCPNNIVRLCSSQGNHLSFAYCGRHVPFSSHSAIVEVCHSTICGDVI